MQLVHESAVGRASADGEADKFSCWPGLPDPWSLPRVEVKSIRSHFRNEYSGLDQCRTIEQKTARD